MHRIATMSPGQAPVPADWIAMLAAEPQLRALAKATAAASRFSCDRRKAWIAIREELCNLVGWFAPDERMNSSAHYAVAAGRLRHLLTKGARR